MRLRDLHIAILLAGLLMPVVGTAQDRPGRERGIPFPNAHYSDDAYGERHQNWDVEQDDRGFVYVANNDGVLEYDGEDWRTIPVETEAFVRSLATDSLVYVGGTGNFGYLRPDTTGTLEYKSLVGRLDSTERAFEDVWYTHATEDGVYYQSNERLFRWDGTQIESWDSDVGFHTSFSVRGRFFVREFRGRGLLEMKGDSLEPVPGGEAFAETPIYMMAPYPADRILIGTQTFGLLLYDGQTMEEFAPEVTSYLQEKNFYHGTALPGGRYALATLGGGVVIVDEKGNLDRVLDGDELPDTVVNHLFAEEDGTLWMALNNSGVFRGNVGNAVTTYDKSRGLGGLIMGMNRHEDRLHVATDAGVYELESRKQEGQLSSGWQFSQIQIEGSPLGRAFLSTRNGALLATQGGIYHQEEGDPWQPLVREAVGGDTLQEDTWFDFEASSEASIAYAGGGDGILLLRHNGIEWSAEIVGGVSQDVRSLTKSRPRVLWVNTKQGRVLRLRLSSDRSRVETTTPVEFPGQHPEGLKFFKRVNGKFLVIAKDGAYRKVEGEKDTVRLERMTGFLPDRDSSASVQTLAKGPNDDLWLAMGSRVYRGRRAADGTYQWDSVEALRFAKSGRVRIYPEEDGVVWVGSGRRLFRYDSRARTVPVPPFESARPVVRHVTAVGTGRVLYGGAPRSSSAPTLSVPPTANNLSIHVATPFYSTTEAREYQFRLRGRSDGWSDWQETPGVTYTNLWEGTYHLEARARTPAGAISRPAQFAFHVQPPWYRTIWAYLFYATLGGLVGLGGYRLYKLRQAREQARKRAEQLRRERLAKRRLEEANDQLREANRLKEEFLANMSHELRTPLTNILGFADVLREEVPDEQERFVEVVEENGHRLLNTFDALLDLANLRSGDTELELQPVEVKQHVRSAVDEIRSSAEEKGLDVRVEMPDEPVYASLDGRYLDQVLRNLLENAVKFTEDGFVSASVERDDTHVDIAVTDTGIGIDEDFLTEVFDDFKQESRGMAREYEGNGLGLSISQRLVDLMEGEIFVESTKGEGTTFTVRLAGADAPSAPDASEDGTDGAASVAPSDPPSSEQVGE